MDFLADVWVTCPVCDGHRFDRETLQVRFKGFSIADVLEMDVQEGLRVFENIPRVHDRLQTLAAVGLDYLKIGQPSPTLSGGEAQRIKLARELTKRSTGNTLYLLDEPTTGLHFADIQMLLQVLQDFVDAGNTVLVVEHNLDVIKTADWVIDLGPEGGAGGGRIVGEGTPEQIAGNAESYTGQSLARVLQSGTGNGHGRKAASRSRPARTRVRRQTVRQATKIEVRGAGQHNLRQVDVAIDRDRLSVFCGPSGSGKSSLAMDTIYAEGQRRYVESLSSYARQFVNQMPKPRLEHIEGLSPAIAIEQKNFGSTSRSTVGTVTEVYDYLRILFSRLGTPWCPDCDCPIGTQTLDQVVDRVMDHAEGQKLLLMAPLTLDGSQTWAALFEEIRAEGFIRVRVDGQTFGIDEVPAIDRRQRHDVQVVVDRISVSPKSRSRIADSVESALALGRGVIHVARPDDQLDERRWPVQRHSQHLACDRCSRSFDLLSPHNFSFNSSLGWCPECEGIGTRMGANPDALLRATRLSLRDNAINVWPDAGQPLAAAMLEALRQQAGLPLDVPFEQLDARARRMVFYGTGNRWFEATVDGVDGDLGLPPGGMRFRFQYQGLYTALSRASKLSPRLRGRLQNLIDTVECGVCGGSRLRDDASAVRFQERSIDGLCRLPLEVLQREIKSWKLDSREKKIAGEVIREIRNRVKFLNDVGLGYISLSRAAATLSNGEAQRIRLAGQLGSGLCGVLYVLDEPTIGLHPRDNTRLIAALHRLRDLGNTLLVVEHDREVIAGADAVFDFGPGAGSRGGRIVAQAAPDRLPRKRGSVTGPYLDGRKAIPIPENRRPAFVSDAERRRLRQQKKTPVEARALEIRGARQNNLQTVNVKIPLQTLTAVTGPSGCGKSSLVNDVLYNTLASRLHRASLTPGRHDEILGVEFIDKVIRVDQQPLGNTPTSNPATYTGAFDLIRTLFAQLPDSRLRGFTQRRFSFNVPGGRCENCAGNGQICIEMHFLPDVWVPCEACQGKRYNEETLGVRFHGQSINDVLEMTCGQAVQLFANIPKIARILQTLCDVGLDYLTLGQSAPTLSGGEAQRVKLASELARPDTGNTLYLLDEPTTGLHFDDLAKLLKVLHRLVDLGNTVVLIEHNLDVIKSADWVIDLGPEAGQQGGQVVFAGTPEQLVEHARKVDTAKRRPRNALPSHTGLALASVLEAGPYEFRSEYQPTELPSREEEQLDLAEIGQGARMPWETDGRLWHTRTRVGRNGKPVRWSGEFLGKVVDYIESRGEWSDTDWNSRSVVEIASAKKSNGWFFHALTGETWLLKLKFRCRKGTFKRAELQEKIKLATPNQMDELPIYGNKPRVRVANHRGVWQEVEIQVHSQEEIDTPEFWEFLDTAIRSFQQKQERIQLRIDDHMPWTKMGQKWHFLRKGFPPGKKVQWEVEVLEELQELLQRVAPDGQFLWNNKQVVHVFVPDQKEPWVSIQTKKLDAVHLQVSGPANAVTLGRIAEIGHRPSVKMLDEDREAARLCFRSIEEVQSGLLEEFLTEHRNLLTV
jgi:excinuclease ABC subunit A